MDIAWIQLLLTRELTSFSKELELFQDESQIWMTLPGVSNSTGNLVLHVCGNLKHFVGAVLGGTGYVRNRELEFSQRGLTRAALCEELQQTIEVVQAVLANLPDQTLSLEYPDAPGGLRVPTGLFLLHLNGHLANHLGQAGYLRRILTGENRSSGQMAITALSAPQ